MLSVEGMEHAQGGRHSSLRPQKIQSSAQASDKLSSRLSDCWTAGIYVPVSDRLSVAAELGSIRALSGSVDPACGILVTMRLF